MFKNPFFTEHLWTPPTEISLGVLIIKLFLNKTILTNSNTQSFLQFRQYRISIVYYITHLILAMQAHRNCTANQLTDLHLTGTLELNWLTAV